MLPITENFVKRCSLHAQVVRTDSSVRLMLSCYCNLVKTPVLNLLLRSSGKDRYVFRNEKPGHAGLLGGEFKLVRDT